MITAALHALFSCVQSPSLSLLSFLHDVRDRTQMRESMTHFRSWELSAAGSNNNRVGEGAREGEYRGRISNPLAKSHLLLFPGLASLPPLSTAANGMSDGIIL